jgi:nucleotide-binding universal stress UspA family protein
MVKRPGTGRYKKVSIALDGSPAALRALRAAVALAPGAAFRVVYAHAPVAASRLVVERSLRDIKDRVRAQLEAVFGDRTADQPNVSIDVSEDSPYSALRHASDASDLLVMGTHSKTAWTSGLEIGKLAHHMLAEAPCDLLISPQ